MSNLSNYVAIDCEMVGICPNGEHKSMIGRVSIVDHRENVLIDKYVKPRHPIVDYRTPISGIHPGELERKGEDFFRVQNEVKDILKNKVLIGHSVQNDLSVLELDHPREKTKDLAELCNKKSLQDLAKEYLKRNIQLGTHDSVEDAKATMGIYLALAQRNGW